MTALRLCCVPVLCLLLPAGCRPLAVQSPELPPLAVVRGFDAPECHPLLLRDVSRYPAPAPARFNQGLLWRVTRQDRQPSYVFGTAHVAAHRAAAQFEQAVAALAGSRVFALESLPDPEEVAQFRERTQLKDGARLDQQVSPALYRETVRILGERRFTEEEVATMTPWAAHLSAVYQPDQDPILDLALMHRAEALGARVEGLESLASRGDMFEAMPQETQLRLLADSVCHYDFLGGEIERLLALYRAEDLGGLATLQYRYAHPDDAAYQEFDQQMVVGRNYNMVQKMLPLLEAGGAFIAVGALHLPGETGMLSLLEQEGFLLTRVTAQ